MANISTIRGKRLRGAATVASLLLAATVAAATLLLFEGRMRAAAQSDSQQQHQTLFGQSQANVDRKNTGCVSCHTATDEPSMHPTRTVHLACIDCHGGDPGAVAAAGMNATSAEYEQLKKRAHPQPNDPSLANTSANPPRLYTKWLRKVTSMSNSSIRAICASPPKRAASNGCHARRSLQSIKPA